MAYEVRQFRPAIYLLTILGFSGYAIASQSPGMWLLGTGAAGACYLLTYIGRFRPLPPILANIASIVSLAYVIHVGRTSNAPPVMLIGQFLFFLQLVKLWEQRTNRDWATLLVLSFLLIIAASMNTSSLWFGILLLAYLVLLLYCCLLFQLKVDADGAKKSAELADQKLRPRALRHDQRSLGSSMRRLTAIVAVVGAVFAVGIFVGFPRGAVGLLGPRFRGDNRLTGFRDRVEFESLARITQSHDRIAFVKVLHNGKLVEGSQTLLLRGLTFDNYLHLGRGGDWVNSEPRARRRDLLPRRVLGGETFELASLGGDEWRQHITLWPTGTTVLFGMPGLTDFTPQTQIQVRFNERDSTLRVFPDPKDRIEYDVVSSNSLPPWGPDAQPNEATTVDLFGVSVPISPPQALLSMADSAEVRSQFPRIYDFARRPDVCGVDNRGRNLADLRMAQATIGPLDRVIAGNIEKYLHTNFTYTLDLTNAALEKGQDPLEQFLYNWKRGHCEYFAGAMTMLCRSIGLRARMVIGFKCGPENYNDFTRSYAVYDSDAHAWVEVLTPQGWIWFDPTSSRTDVQQVAGWGGKLKQFFEYCELQYANAVIAYDAQSRRSLLASLEVSGDSFLARCVMAVSSLEDWFTSNLFWVMIALLMAPIGLSLVFTWHAWRRRRLLRRAKRIGIQSLPQDQQLKLARQLGFYDDLLQLLEHHGLVRPAHRTPMEFSRSLSFLPAGAYDTILRLTQLFYSIRYGGARLTESRQGRLEAVLSTLSTELRQSLSNGR